MLFLVMVFVAGILSGATAAITGFGIGSVRGDVDRGSVWPSTPLECPFMCGVSPESFRRVVGILVGVLGLWLILK